MNTPIETRPVVLVVDDKKNMLRLMAKVLANDARVCCAAGGAEAVQVLQTEPVCVVLCDLRMPDMDGLQVLQASKRLRPRSEFILMTAYASVPTAVEALRLGAFDYLTKPFEPEAARAAVLRALGRETTPGPAPATHREREENEVLPGMLALSPAMRAMSELAERIAASEATTLLIGETGTGKERLARAIHRLSPRADQRFIGVNCAAVPTDLLERELFGCAKDALADAARDQAGAFEDANEGTLFLDEISELPRPLQVKVARGLEKRATQRVGETSDRAANVRLIAARTSDPDGTVEDENLHGDLWSNAAIIRIPPLRERPEDVDILATHFLHQRRSASPSLHVTGFSHEALALLRACTWPGNVRQLRAAVERACAVAGGEQVLPNDLPAEIIGHGPAEAEKLDLTSMTWTEAIEKGRGELARRYLEEMLRKHGGVVADAAQHARVERESFYRLMRRYGVDPDSYRPKRGPGERGG